MIKNRVERQIDYRKFYERLREYIPSIQSKKNKAEIVLDIDMILAEARAYKYTIKSKTIQAGIDFEFDAVNYEDDEIIDLMFQEFHGSDIGEIMIMQNANLHGPIECKFSELKNEIDLLPMSIFPGGDVVILWKDKKNITVFHHTGYFAHIFCE